MKDLPMKDLYLSTTYAAALVCLLISFLLFIRRKNGERSRKILVVIILFSVLNYVTRFIDICRGDEPEVLISIDMLLLAIFMVTSYLIYPIEVISPGYLNFRRIVRIYIPWMILVIVSVLSSYVFGVTFIHYGSLLDMLPYITRFDVWFRLLLVLFIFVPVLTILFIPHTRRYSNVGNDWTRKYIVLFVINTLAYILVLALDLLIVKILYYYVSVGCSFGIAYMELHVRLIKKQATSNDNEKKTLIATHPEDTVLENKGEFIVSDAINQNTQSTLCNRLNLYMTQKCVYRDPDLSIHTLSTMLNTNRTTLAHAIQGLGYDSFSSYINMLRINDFIFQIQKEKTSYFQEAFYDAGFRSRATAIRNFKQVTGKTPSEYFQNKCIVVDDED